MKTESTHLITHVCWDMDPKTKARCTRPPEHKGDHYARFVRPSWDRPGTTWRN
ncbi:hypothetical protein [Streptomyces sp. Ncost-T10-10d]|uniref:hypothetical protein n=1 Tax=Streptomyces sp. Ncost-T10-10d TaxID=1839774 RepID=UPI00081EC4C8|nr:hypothetical protein [Streptomyces sp. Ncost-T10-10d]SCF66765.1 hypothetical protein GA0115254_110571 [Streptomyces sp. Ncost-T10-10d]